MKINLNTFETTSALTKDQVAKMHNKIAHYKDDLKQWLKIHKQAEVVRKLQYEAPKSPKQKVRLKEAKAKLRHMKLQLHHRHSREDSIKLKLHNLLLKRPNRSVGVRKKINK